MKLHLVYRNGFWNVWRNRESSRYALPITKSKALEDAICRAVKYLKG